VEADLRPVNLGLATSKRRAQDRSAWRKLVTINGYVYDKLLKKKKKEGCQGFFFEISSKKCKVLSQHMLCFYALLFAKTTCGQKLGPEGLIDPLGVEDARGL